MSIKQKLDAQVYFQSGMNNSDRGLHDLAISDYSKAIDADPSGDCGFGVIGGAYTNRANAYGRKGLYDEAISDFSKAIEENPQYCLAYNNRGTIYYLKGLYDFAISDFSKAIEIDINNAEVFSKRGLVYVSKELFTKAISDFSIAGNLYKKSGDIEKSIQCFESVEMIKNR